MAEDSSGGTTSKQLPHLSNEIWTMILEELFGGDDEIVLSIYGSKPYPSSSPCETFSDELRRMQLHAWRYKCEKPQHTLTANTPLPVQALAVNRMFLRERFRIVYSKQIVFGGRLDHSQFQNFLENISPESRGLIRRIRVLTGHSSMDYRQQQFYVTLTNMHLKSVHIASQVSWWLRVCRSVYHRGEISVGLAAEITNTNPPDSLGWLLNATYDGRIELLGLEVRLSDIKVAGDGDGAWIARLLRSFHGWFPDLKFQTEGDIHLCYTEHEYSHFRFQLRSARVTDHGDVKVVGPSQLCTLRTH